MIIVGWNKTWLCNRSCEVIFNSNNSITASNVVVIRHNSDERRRQVGLPVKRSGVETWNITLSTISECNRLPIEPSLSARRSPKQNSGEKIQSFSRKVRFVFQRTAKRILIDVDLVQILSMSSSSCELSRSESIIRSINRPIGPETRDCSDLQENILMHFYIYLVTIQFLLSLNYQPDWNKIVNA